ncbi:MAG TPA: hypothetical protein VLZ03_02210 [Thermodesulfobacteriota bacterium]|nr:hypothetical protein [Thermodesulfobacteriota bacterium]
MLNWDCGCWTVFWGDFGGEEDFWRCTKALQPAWEEDFLSTSQNENPMPIGSPEVSVQGNVSLSLTPQADIISTIYERVGNVALTLLPTTKNFVINERGQKIPTLAGGTINLTPYGARLLSSYIDESGITHDEQKPTVPVSQWEVQGNVFVSLAPQATVTREWVMQGNIGFSITPQATVTREWQVQAAIGVSLLPAASVMREWVIQGNIIASLLPGSQSIPEYTKLGAISVFLTPGAQSVPEYVKTGMVTLSLFPAAAVTRDWTVQGNVPFILVPQSDITREWVVQEAIAFNLVPSHTFTREWTVTGSTTLTVIPNSACLYEPPSEHIIEGDILFGLTPAANVAREWVLQGNVPVSLFLEAFSTEEIPVQGNMVFALVPDGETSADYLFFGDIPCSLAPQSFAALIHEWEIMGDIVLSLILRGTELFNKPKGAYGYDWDPSKHFFVEGKSYDASLEFGLDKRLPIGESGDYKYDA